MKKTNHIHAIGLIVIALSLLAGAVAFFNLSRFSLLAQSSSTGAIEILSSTTGNYGGRVTSSPAGIDCPGTCRASFPVGTQVTLTATPNAGRYLASFGYRSGAFCQGQNNGESFYRNNPCVVIIPSNGFDTTRVMHFNFDTNTIQVTKRGTGGGTVTSNPAAINCGSICSATIPSRSNPNENPTYASNNYSSYALTASPAAGSVFAGWGSKAEGGWGCSNQSTRNTNTVCNITGSWDSPSAFHAIAYFEKAPTQPSRSASGAPTAGSNEAPIATTQTPEQLSDLKEVTVNGNLLQNLDKVEIAQNEVLKLEGKTTPNSTVKLFIFSEPQEATVKADADGHWSYSVSGLAPGDHHIEFEVTDTAGKTTPRAQLLAFKVNEAAANSIGSTNQKNVNRTANILLGVTALLALVTAISLYLHHAHIKKHYPKHKKAEPSTPSTD